MKWSLNEAKDTWSPDKGTLSDTSVTKQVVGRPIVQKFSLFRRGHFKETDTPREVGESIKEGNLMPPLLIWPFIRVLLLAAVILTGVIWLPLAWRYRAHRAALGALAVVLCSVTSAFLWIAHINRMRSIRTVEGEWPGVIVTAALGGLCDVVSPIICFAVVFWAITFTSVATLEIHRAIKTHLSDDDKSPSGDDNDGDRAVEQ